MNHPLLTIFHNPRRNLQIKALLTKSNHPRTKDDAPKVCCLKWEKARFSTLFKSTAVPFPISGVNPVFKDNNFLRYKENLAGAEPQRWWPP